MDLFIWHFLKNDIMFKNAENKTLSQTRKKNWQFLKANGC